MVVDWVFVGHFVLLARVQGAQGLVGRGVPVGRGIPGLVFGDDCGGLLLVVGGMVVHLLCQMVVGLEMVVQAERAGLLPWGGDGVFLIAVLPWAFAGLVVDLLLLLCFFVLAMLLNSGFNESLLHLLRVLLLQVRE